MAETRAVLPGALEQVATEPAAADPGPVALLLRALFAAQDGVAERLYDCHQHEMDVAELVARVLEPALVEAGESWFRGECRLCQERSASSFLFRKIVVLLDRAKAANPEPRGLVLVGCAAGDRHEGAPLLVGLALELAGWRSIHLGADLPVAEYQAAIDHWRPDALAISFVLSRNVRRRFEELSKLGGAPVYLGGRSIVNYQSLAQRFGLTPLPGRSFAAVATLIDHLAPD